MKRLTMLLFLLGAMIAPSSASAAFAIEDFDVSFTDPQGNAAAEAGSHPFEMTTSFKVATELNGKGGNRLIEAVRNLFTVQVKGFVGNPTAVPQCATADFLTSFPAPANPDVPGSGGFFVSKCPNAAAVGRLALEGTGLEQIPEERIHSAVFNLEPPPGVAARLGFWSGGVPVTIELGVSSEFPYSIVGGPTNVSQIIEVAGAELTLWGVPADPRHDSERGLCLDGSGQSVGECPANVPAKPFLTLPRACEGPLATLWEANSWPSPDRWLSGSVLTHDEGGNHRGFAGCDKLDFSPEAAAVPSAKSAESPAGLEFTIEVDDEGLVNPEGIAAADYTKVVASLPTGVTANPGSAEGLGVCTPSQFGAATLGVAGCPGASKLGTVEVVTPLLENRTLPGSVYLAQQDDPATSAPGAENPFDSLLALYFVIREPELGIFAKLPVEVSTDPASGQIVTTASDLPPFPLSRVTVALRSGPRAPLITPPSCDADPAQPGNQAYETKVELTPSSGAAPLTTTSSFEITSGPGGSPCPASGAPPFDPGFEAGSENNAAGAYSPFVMRLTRRDGDQDLTKFSATLPPGVTGKLAGTERCSDQALVAARAKTGRQELASPSCPAGSKVGSVLAGAGVGSALTYVPGSLYLAGPYNGAPLSVVAIVPAVAGPFDVGTVVTRVALSLNPKTAQVEVDGSRSDPIPHILAGIPLKVRDVRVYTDRPEFTLNATSCKPMETTASLFGSFLDVFDPADDRAVALSSRYQAASCASLGFKPKLRLQLKGGAKRGAFPGLRATYRPRAGNANLQGLAVRLPTSAFLEQGHIRTICTRVQFAADACPPRSRYGYIRAFTPLLDEPLQGPVYLRSSNHNLPDLVFDLKGLVDIEVATRIDSKNGGIRATVENAPDAPITKVELSMQGGKKGLIVNSRNLCAKPARANVRYLAQNGKTVNGRPQMEVKCKGRTAKRTKGKRASAAR